MDHDMISDQSRYYRTCTVMRVPLLVGRACEYQCECSASSLTTGLPRASGGVSIKLRAPLSRGAAADVHVC